jgi:hypothetical protein
VPFDLFARVAVEDQADGELESANYPVGFLPCASSTHLVVLPHLVGNEISVLQLVDESVTSVVDQKTTDTS